MHKKGSAGFFCQQSKHFVSTSVVWKQLLVLQISTSKNKHHKKSRLCKQPQHHNWLVPPQTSEYYTRRIKTSGTNSDFGIRKQEFTAKDVLTHFTSFKTVTPVKQHEPVTKVRHSSLLIHTPGTKPQNPNIILLHSTLLFKKLPSFFILLCVWTNPKTTN